MEQEVRRSIVRICFDWKKEGKETNKRVMVIPGIILSIDKDGCAHILANAHFFKKGNKFELNFPNATGYEAGIPFESPYSDTVKSVGNHFYTLAAKPHENGYIKPVRFETQPTQTGNQVDTFVFPREEYITPTGYRRGSIISAIPEYLTHNCPMHEYGFLGSPVFNLSGDLVGITYLDRGYLQAWTVQKLQNDVLEKLTSTFVLNGNPIGQAAAAEAPIAEAQVE